MYSHYEIANFPDSDLRDIFLQVSSEMNIPPSLVEKDFWVSLMLKYLYSDSPWKHSLLFKGGTSLSKCYRVIHRFSEDIDLLLDWRELGYPKEGPEQEKTRKKQEQSNDQLMAKTEMFLIEHMRPRMKSDLDKILKKDFEIETIGSNIVFRYPCAMPVYQTESLQARHTLYSRLRHQSRIVAIGITNTPSSLRYPYSVPVITIFRSGSLIGIFAVRLFSRIRDSIFSRCAAPSSTSF